MRIIIIIIIYLFNIESSLLLFNAELLLLLFNI